MLKLLSSWLHHVDDQIDSQVSIRNSGHDVWPTTSLGVAQEHAMLVFLLLGFVFFSIPFSSIEVSSRQASRQKSNVQQVLSPVTHSHQSPILTCRLSPPGPPSD